MKVNRASTAGFCMGVSLALRRLDNELKRMTATPEGRLISFGPIIHNPLVMDEYRTQGVLVEENPGNLLPGDRVVIRAHGIPLHTEEALGQKGVFIVDATCPKVKKAQVQIAEHSKDGACLLLFGESDHPEVRGLVSYASSGAKIFSNEEEADELNLERSTDYFLAAQTTQDKKLFEKIAVKLSSLLGKRLLVLDTICDATMKRQKETIEISKTSDIVIVVGGKNSGNTKRLAEIAMDNGVRAVQIEQASELTASMLEGVRVAGLTAGASTPQGHIDEVQNRLKNFTG